MNRSLLRIAVLVSLFVLPAAICARGAEDTWNAPVVNPAGPLVMRVVMVEDEQEDPAAAGKAAAEALQKAMQGVALKAIVVSECFEDKENKEKLLQGIGSVLDPKMVFGGATYGSFTQQGCTDFDSVCLLGIGGDGIGVSAALVTEMGTAKLSFDEHEEEIKRLLQAAGSAVSEKLQRTDRDQDVDFDSRCPFAEESVPGGRSTESPGGRVSHDRRLGEQECRSDVCLLPRKHVSGQRGGADAVGGL